MEREIILPGVVHEVPQDLKKALRTSEELIETWNGLTPLGRNEWICWVEFVKKPETRAAHITRLCSEILSGKRRPCCWAGCIHRNKD